MSTNTDGGVPSHPAHTGPPPPPSPSARTFDTRIVSADPNNDGIWGLSSRAAMQLFAVGLEYLVHNTPQHAQPDNGGINRRPTFGFDHEPTAMDQLTEAVANYAREFQMTQHDVKRSPEPIDGVRLKKRPATFASPSQPPGDSDAQETIIHIVASYQELGRPFHSPSDPGISITGFIDLMARCCPMSPAGYLAASYYIHRVVSEQRIAASNQTVHRLALAGLSVSMKALEDNKWTHQRMSKMVEFSGAQLTRLELNFCKLANFRLEVTPETLTAHWKFLGSLQAQPLGDLQPNAMMSSTLLSSGLTGHTAPAGKENEGY